MSVSAPPEPRVAAVGLRGGGRRRVLVAGGMLAGVAALAWLAGFVWFVRLVGAERPPTALPHAEGIVVLTGGADRIRAGLALLGRGAAPLMLISGAGRGTDLADFVPQDSPEARQLDGAITLGHVATTTRGNARETALWAARHHLASVIVVTADYHMPRALLELRRHLAGVRLIAAPVTPPAMARTLTPHTLLLLAGEFDKYLAVRLGFGGFAARHVEKYL